MSACPPFRRALLRRPGPDLGQGLTTADAGAPDHALALVQFAAYERALQDAGLATTVLPDLPGFPDAHFVEDTAVILPEVAVITRPGAPERDGEQQSVAVALVDDEDGAPLIGDRPVTRIEAPGALDGGDVLVAGRHVLIGVSARTNRHGAAQLGAVCEAHGYAWQAVPVGDGLHLKSGVNGIGEGLLLVTPAFAGRPELAAFRTLVVPPEEEYAANSLWLGDVVVTPAGYPRVHDMLTATGARVVTVDTSEFRRMDGGLTCLSLRF